MTVSTWRRARVRIRTVYGTKSVQGGLCKHLYPRARRMQYTCTPFILDAYMCSRGYLRLLVIIRLPLNVSFSLIYVQSYSSVLFYTYRYTNTIRDTMTYVRVNCAHCLSGYNRMTKTKKKKSTSTEKKTTLARYCTAISAKKKKKKC